MQTISKSMLYSSIAYSYISIKLLQVQSQLGCELNSNIRTLIDTSSIYWQLANKGATRSR